MGLQGLGPTLLTIDLCCLDLYICLCFELHVTPLTEYYPWASNKSASQRRYLSNHASH